MLEKVLLIHATSSPRNASSFPLGWFKEKKLMIWRNSDFFFLILITLVVVVVVFALWIRNRISLVTPKDN